jgi:uncharacterized membrane protein
MALRVHLVSVKLWTFVIDSGGTMLFFIVLATATLITAAVQGIRRRFEVRSAARVGLAVGMAFAGTAHLAMPAPFLQHLPPWTPAAQAIIFLTGIVEIVLGAALVLGQPWRQRAGLALAAYLVAVFPGNVYVAVADVDVDGQPGGWYPWLRRPLQALFIVWALWSTGRPADADRRRLAVRRRDAGVHPDLVQNPTQTR